MSSTEAYNSVLAQLEELSLLQSEGNSVYPKGIFPSQRHHPSFPYKREDDNLFFTASIIHILDSFLNEFNDEETKVYKRLKSEALLSYSLFKNKDGLDTYNFWQTKPSRHFPNGMFMHRYKHFQIPDDVDDTALVYATEGSSKERVSLLRDKLKKHANLSYKRAFNPLTKYRDFKCYSTFFGKEMYIEFDVCVLCNLMSMILSQFNESELDEYDLGTLSFIDSVVENNEHIIHPFYSAPNYPTTELILYHLTRLIPHLPKAYKEKVERKVKSNTAELLSKSTGMSCILLENAALKLGVSVPETQIKADKLINDKQFFFFHAGMITAFENRLAQKLANKSIFHLRYTSKALNRALLIENVMLKRRVTL